ncbi:TBC1 domain family member 5 homolog B, related [Eimeria tenella]|uniref:TBC1 domain family member 5 homolog B, related n=1 Tax=Eimeria tenella TaxID=5802 RepID=U6KTD1_EIMTE|nr:TBC1 domain family member 5 homolog B, related [Eimeria tenella]CDJ40183.1 TBC1 domain family member 5 homolog B, related [Eimeria tenella]|eukprot:XP_013230936.1 TBC1 domain family member 5 homolog B, related [Eimeria tenella]
MDDTAPEGEVGLLQLTPDVLPALSRAVEHSTANFPLKTLAEHVLYGDAVDRQQLDIVRLQRQLEAAVAGDSSGTPAQGERLVVPFLRRLHWARLLGLLSGDTLEEWAEQVKEQRQQYESLRRQQQLSASQLAALDPQRFHPLAATAGNPWSQKQADEELQEEIWRDIERTYPERQIFNREVTRRSLQRVLFAWAKSNTDVSYKQGMNEVLAVLYLACAREAIPSSPLGDTDSAFSVIFSADPAHIEADAFRLFDGLMTGCCLRSMYLPPQKEPAPAEVKDSLLGPLGGGPPMHSRATGQSAVLLRCSRVFNSLLAKADPAVYLHLEGLGVEPQLFLLRWLRLLFSREFHVEDTLLIWDALFSDSWLSTKQQATPASSPVAAPPAVAAKSTVPARTPQEFATAASERLPLVDYFAVAMLKFIRQHLLESDLSSCLRRLLKFPPIESVQCIVALSLAVRRGGTPTSAVAAGDPRSSSSSNSSRKSRGNNTSPVQTGTMRSSKGAPRFIQQPPPLTPTVINTPQLQSHLQPEQLQREPLKKKDAPLESTFARTRESVAAADHSEDPSTAGLLGSHIDAMRQALAFVAGECNDLPASVSDLLMYIDTDLRALKSILEGAPYSASVFKLTPGVAPCVTAAVGTSTGAELQRGIATNDSKGHPALPSV